MKKERNKKKDSRNSKIALSIIVGLFTLLVGANYLISYYENKVDVANKEIFDSLPQGGFSLFDAYRLDAEQRVAENLPKGAHMWLNPGGSFQGKLGIKNHDSFDHKFSVKTEEAIYREDAEGNEIEEGVEVGALPVIDLFQTLYTALPDEVIFFDYVVSVPEDVEPGLYRINTLLTVVDDTKKVVRTAGGLILDFAVGVPVFVHVVEGELPVHEYIDYSGYAKEFALSDALAYLRLVLSVMLGAVTVYLIYLAYKAEE